MKKVEDVDLIFNFHRIINSKEDIYKYVEEPLIPIVKYLYDLNILTTMTSANTKNGHKEAYVIIDYDTLNEHNKKVVNELMDTFPDFCSKQHFSIAGDNMEFCMNMPIDTNTDFLEVWNFYFDKFKDFEIQEIHSTWDCTNGAKNIYSIYDAIWVYLTKLSYKFMHNIKDHQQWVQCIQQDNLDENSKELLFLEKLGAKRYYHEYSGLYIYKYGYYMTDSFAIKKALKETKDTLFVNKEYKIGDVNRNVLTQFLQHEISEDFFFNEEDQRFYGNQELLERHHKFLNSKDKSLIKKK